MALDDIIRKIKANASEKVEKLRKEALEEGGGIIKKAEEEADGIRDDLVERFRKEAEAEKRGMVIKVRMEEKKKLLNLKRELIDRAFKQAEEEISNLNKEEYLDLMKKFLLSTVNLQNEEVLVSPRDETWMRGGFINQLREELGKDLKLFPELNEGERGFILRKEGMQINCTFSALLVSLREELEMEVARRLLSS